MLRARAAGGGEQDGVGDRERDGKREERRLYIESRVRKVVVAAGDGDGDGEGEMDVDVDVDADVGRDGGGGGGGPRVGESEIKSLERVVRGLQGEEGEEMEMETRE